MSELLNLPENFKKIPSRAEIRIIIQARIQQQPEHLRGREVERIAAEMAVTKRQVYRILKDL